MIYKIILHFFVIYYLYSNKQIEVLIGNIFENQSALQCYRKLTFAVCIDIQL